MRSADSLADHGDTPPTKPGSAAKVGQGRVEEGPLAVGDEALDDQGLSQDRSKVRFRVRQANRYRNGRSSAANRRSQIFG